MKANTVGVMLRTKDFRVIIEKTPLISPTNCEFEVYKNIDKLLSAIYNSETIYRSSGVFFENLIEKMENSFHFLRLLKTSIIKYPPYVMFWKISMAKTLLR